MEEGPSPGIKQSRHEADHSYPSGVQVKYEYSSTSTPPVYLHGMYMDKFTFFIVK